MRIVNYEFPHSSFLSVEKDMEIITNKMLENERLKRLLYYTTKDALDKPNISQEESLKLFGKNIKIVPKLQIDDKELNYVFIIFEDFLPNPLNPHYRDNKITFDIICHYEQWQLNNSFALRPFRIAAEIDSMFNGKHLTGIGTLEFEDAFPSSYGENLAGISLSYKAIHGNEDKNNFSNPIENDEFIDEFNKIWNKQ